jgi:hypothetical protein
MLQNENFQASHGNLDKLQLKLLQASEGFPVYSPVQVLEKLTLLVLF